MVAMWVQVDTILALDKCELVISRSGCLIPVKVSFDSCAVLGVLGRWSFLKDCGKNAAFFCWEYVSECVARKLFTVLNVGYCVRHKNQYSTYCAVLS